jgi:hypothetical protein
MKEMKRATIYKLAALLVALACLLPADAQIFIDQTSDMNGPIPSSGGAIRLSNITIPSTSSIGTVVGTFSVIGGSGSYTYSLISNPGGLFSISGNQLQVAAALTAGSDPITVQANNGAGSVFTQPFTIIVTGTFACSNRLDFSQSCNSQYLALLH